MAGPYFWVGGSGNWSDATNHWATVSGGAPNVANVPTSADNVNFDILSNTTAYTVTVDATAICKDMTWALPAVSGVPTLAGASALSVAGSLTKIATMVWTYSGTLTFSSTAAGKTVTSAAVAYAGTVIFNGASGGWTLQDNFTNGAANTTTLTNGSLVINGKTLSTGFLTTATGTKALDGSAASSVIAITGVTGTPLNISATGMTLTPTNLTVNVTGGTANTALTLTFGALNWGAVNITGTGIWTLTSGVLSFTGFSYTSTTDRRDNLILAGDFNIAAGGTLSFVGNSIVNRAFVSGNTVGTTRTIGISGGTTPTITNADFRDINLAPTYYAWGDSLTAGGVGYSYPLALAADFSPIRVVSNQGVSADSSTQILTRFQALPASWGSGTAIWSGRNNYTDPTTVKADIATMVADLTTTNYIVIGVIKGEFPSEYAGQSGSNTIDTLNSDLATTYGSKFVDAEAILVAAYDPAIPADVLDHNNGIPPFSLRGNVTSFVGTLNGALNASATTFALTQTTGAVNDGTILTIGTELIYITTIVGNNVTSSVRGYASTTAASHSNGAAYNGTDRLHLNAAGYAIVATAVYNAIQSQGTWGIAFTGTSVGDAQGNSGITFDAPVTRTWDSTKTGAKNWSDTENWVGGVVPLPQDGVVLPALALATTITVDEPRFGASQNYSAFNRTLTITGAGASTPAFFGSMLFGSGMTLSGATGSLAPSGRGSHTITSNGKGPGVNWGFFGFGGTYTLADNFPDDGTNITLNAGTFNDGGFSTTVGAFTTSGSPVKAAVINGTLSIKNITGTPVNFSAANTTVSGTGTIKLTGAVTVSITISGGGLTLPNIWWSNTAATGILIFSGANTIGDLKINRTTARAIRFPAGVTTTILSWTDESLGTAVLTVDSSTGGSAATLSKAFGIVSTDYLSLKDSAATGGAGWYAGANSTSVSGNSGWIFTALPTHLGAAGMGMGMSIGMTRI